MFLNFFFFFFFFFLLLENLGAMAYSRYTGFREITDRDVLELHCTNTSKKASFRTMNACILF